MEAGFQEENIMSSQKGFYLFQEVVTAADVKPYVLRFWETEFDDINPNTLENGKKSYSQKDIKIIHLIKKLLFDEKMSIPEAKVAIKQRLSEIDNIEIEPTATFSAEEETVSVSSQHDQAYQDITNTGKINSSSAVEVIDEAAISVESDFAEADSQEAEDIKEERVEQINIDCSVEIRPMDMLRGSIHKAHAQLETVLNKIDQKLESLK